MDGSEKVVRIRPSKPSFASPKGGIMRFRRSTALGAMLLLGLPSLAHAQASIAGVVKDTSGAVLP
ncbi:MAG: hypothetical protein C5B57_05040, partial [Blastocatellia bacterium]